MEITLVMHAIQNDECNIFVASFSRQMSSRAPKCHSFIIIKDIFCVARDHVTFLVEF